MLNGWNDVLFVWGMAFVMAGLWLWVVRRRQKRLGLEIERLERRSRR